MNWYIHALTKYAIFSGRACRREYWFFVLFNMLVSYLLLLLDHVLGLKGLVTIAGIYELLVFVPSLAVLARRLHDLGCQAWWVLLTLPSKIAFLIMFLAASYLIAPNTQQEWFNSLNGTLANVVVSQKGSRSNMADKHLAHKMPSAKSVPAAALTPPAHEIPGSMATTSSLPVANAAFNLNHILILCWLVYMILDLFFYGVIFAFTLVESQRGDNKYGSEPKAPNK